MAGVVDFLFTTHNVPKLQHFFDQNPDMDISALRNDKKNTLLHQMAFQNHLPAMKVFVEHAKKVLEKQYWASNNPYKKSVKQSIQALVNEGNVEGFTCLHYASYRGNVEMIRFLESLGANVLMLTKAGLNALHLAAQGDQVKSAIYLHDKFDINAVDNKKGTPLHWASYIGSEEVSRFLLAQEEIETDCFDSEDHTPLHLAVLYGNTAIVKRLLVKGADRSLKNGKGETPMDLAKSNEFERIALILDNDYSLLQKFKLYCNVRIKYEPQTRSYFQPLSFVLIFVLAVVATHLLIVPNFDMLYLYLAAAFNGLVLAVFLLLLVQPAHVEPLPYRELLEQLPICAECKRHKEPRMNHCDICRQCIRQYDHHCPWINGCVGKHNIKLFPTFLGLLLVSFAEVGLLCVAGILELDFVVKDFRFAESSPDLISVLYKVLYGLILAAIVPYYFPIAYLFCVQISNLFLGRTTLERFGGKKRGTRSKQDSEAPSTDAPDSLDEGLVRNEEEEEGQPTCSFGNCVAMCTRQPWESPDT